MLASRRFRWALIAAVVSANACSVSPATPLTATPSSPAKTPSAASAPPSAATPTNTPAAPSPPLPDIFAARLVIPSVGIDAPVLPSETVVVVSGADDAGGPDEAPLVCLDPPSTGSSSDGGPGGGSPTPSPPEEVRTFTVPNQGIATPKDAFDYLRHRSWIFGHSRWLGTPGVFFALERMAIGDELFIDGTDRRSGESIVGTRFVVTGIYLADIGAGGELVAGERIGASGTPLVILQTSVRESGRNRPWILSREVVLANAENVVRGNLDDPCKYLLLFVVATYAP